MRKIMLKRLMMLFVPFVFASLCWGQTTYTATTGTVSSYNQVTAHFVGVYSSDQTTYTEYPSGYSYPSLLVTDPTLNLVPNKYAGQDININGRSYPITSNDATSVTIQFFTGGTAPANGTPFTINYGGFQSPNGMGGGCYYGGCPAWPFSNFPFSYTLPDGSATASFNNFSGTADFTNQYDVKIDGTASGTDSNGVFVNVTVHWEWAAYCRSGRGGGCTKKFLSGYITIQ